MRKVLYIFGELIEEDISWIASVGKVEVRQNGDTLIAAGHAVSALYIVLEGKLDIISPTNTKLAELGAGDIIGEMSFIEKRLPDISIQTQDEVRILTIPSALVQDRLSKDIGFAARFYRALAILLSNRLRETTAQLAHASKPPSENQALEMSELELDEGLLDIVHVAGDRMRRLLALLEGQNV